MATPPQMLVQLIHIHGGNKGKIQEFATDLITIGRLPTSTVLFPPHEPGVSREHARIERVGNQFRLSDVSKYGTFVNGKQVKEAFLRNGDIIEFGQGGPKVSFTAEIVAAPPPPITRAAEPVPSPPLTASPPAAEAPSLPEEAVGRPQPAPEVRGAARFVGTPEGEASEPGPVQRTAAPLFIQYGPTIRSYRELPVVIGSDPRCDFILSHPGIAAHHAQLLYYQNSYWIKDLTEQNVVRVNRQKIDRQARLSPDDEIECSPEGPTFRFLGDGRLSEVEPVSDEPPRQGEHPQEKDARGPLRAEGESFFARLSRLRK